MGILARRSTSPACRPTGSLTLAGVPVTAGQQIAPADLNGLAYEPNSQFVGSDGFTWSASDGVLYATADATATLSVVPQVAAIVASQPNASEAGAAGQFTVSLASAASGDTTISYTVTGSAVAGTDYQALGGSVVVSAGAASAVIAVIPLGDSFSGGSRSVTLTLSDGGDVYSLGSQSTDTVTIAPLTTSPAAAIAASQPNASESGTSGQFSVSLASAASQATTISYTVSTASGAAIPGTDYQALGGSVVVSAGATSAVIPVIPLGDSFSGSRSVTLTLTGGGGMSGYVLGYQNTATVTIAPLASAPSDASPTNDESPAAITDGSLVLPFAALGIQYVSSSDAQPIISADMDLQPASGAATLVGVETSLNLDGIQGGTQYYAAAGAVANRLYRFTSQIDAASLATGRYNWTMAVTQRYSDGSSQISTLQGYKDLLNWSQSPFGSGWELTSLDWLVANPQGVSLVCGNGTMGFFTSDGQGGYQSEPGPFAFSNLTGNWSNGFTLTGTQGLEETFDSSGRLVTRTDHDGNVATYSYTDGNLTSMVDASHHTTTFTYSGELVSGITDFAGRTTTLGYDAAGRLISITQPDPGSGGPVTAFGYDATTGLLSSTTDAAGNTTTFSYGFAGTLNTVRQADQDQVVFQAVQAASLPASATQSNPASLVVAASVYGLVWDQLDDRTQYTFDRFGLPLSITDAENDVTMISRDANGQVTKIVQPDPGNGAPTTTYVYDARGNLTQETLPDYSLETWTYQTFNTYGGPFDEVTRYTDEVQPSAALETNFAWTYQTVYSIDCTTGDILSVGQVARALVGTPGMARRPVWSPVTPTRRTPATRRLLRPGWWPR